MGVDMEEATALDAPIPTIPSDDDASPGSAIKMCAHNGNVAMAEELFREMEAKSELSVSAYNALIHTCTQAGDLERVEWHLERMRERGFEPTLVTFNSVINACAMLGDAVRAENWLLEMVRAGIQPNHVTYGTICKVFARQGGVKQIESIMQVLESNGSPLNEYFFASLISACGVANPPDPARAERALAEMVRHGLRPQSVKRALARVVGNRRTTQLFEGLGRASSAAAAAATTQAGGTPTAAAMNTEMGNKVLQMTGNNGNRRQNIVESPQRRRPRGRGQAAGQQAPPQLPPQQQRVQRHQPAISGCGGGSPGTKKDRQQQQAASPTNCGFQPPGCDGHAAAQAGHAPVVKELYCMAATPAPTTRASPVYVPGAALLEAAGTRNPGMSMPAAPGPAGAISTSSSHCKVYYCL
mmetsp:Transcript_115127/g.229295  ORF Transcript_115127/g.229295 Transcript_115127/m.229295 type:complete len:413 (-) Transcript_115127:346-1584(-)